MARRIKVLIADDHAVVREGLKMLISIEPDMEIVGEAGDGEQAIDLARKHKPDVIIMDAVMPRCSGVTATQRIARLLPKSRILVLSTSRGPDLEQQLLMAGAAGYVSKQSAPIHLLRGIREVHGGANWFSAQPTMGRSSLISRQAILNSPTPGLTGREIEVLRLVSEGCSNKAIAAQLNITLATVKTHRGQLMHKLNIHGTAKLTQYAIENRLTSSAA
jgi:DNA-binding NarL/FixJ family response regulator